MDVGVRWLGLVGKSGPSGGWMKNSRYQKFQRNAWAWGKWDLTSVQCIHSLVWLWLWFASWGYSVLQNVIEHNKGAKALTEKACCCFLISQDESCWDASTLLVSVSAALDYCSSSSVKTVSVGMNTEDKCGLWQTLVSSFLLSSFWLVLQSNPLNIHTTWQANCVYPNSFQFVKSNYHPSFFHICTSYPVMALSSRHLFFAFLPAGCMSFSFGCGGLCFVDGEEQDVNVDWLEWVR